MQEIINSRSIFIKLNNNNYKVIIEPLGKGLADLIGYSLRRILLLYIEGYAITKIKINHIRNEFSTIKGFREDIYQIIRNIKQINISLKNNLLFETLYLKEKKGGEIRISDFVNSNNLNISNDIPLFHVANNTNINIELFIKKGIGYISASNFKKSFFYNKDIINYLKKKNFFLDKKKKELNILDNKYNYIYIDANFNPIKHIGYEIESINYGLNKNNDRLILNIVSNGLINIKDAYNCANNILINQFTSISKDFDDDICQDINNDLIELNINLKNLNFSNKIINILNVKKINNLLNAKMNFNNISTSIKNRIHFNLLHFKYYSIINYETSNNK